MCIVDPSAVRAGLNTVLAADAGFLVHKDYTAGMLERSINRAHGCAGSILAVLALHRQEPSVLLITPGQDADVALLLGQVVSLITGLFASPASGTQVQVNDQRVLALDLFNLLRRHTSAGSSGEQAAGHPSPE
jgi:hypothetical protein